MPVETATSRVPTAPREGWSIDTALDHVLALINANDQRYKETHETMLTLITGNDKRYEQRFEASQNALMLGFQGQKAAVDNAFAASKSAVDAAFSAQKEGISAALAAADRAVNKAELATEKRFESVNEFRGTLDNQQRTLIPRSEVDVLMRGVNEKIAQLTKQIDQLENVQRTIADEHRGVKGGWGYAVGVVGFVIALLAGIAAFNRQTAMPSQQPVVVLPAGTVTLPSPPTTAPIR